MDGHYILFTSLWKMYTKNVFLIWLVNFQSCAAIKKSHYGFKTYPYPNILIHLANWTIYVKFELQTHLEHPSSCQSGVLVVLWLCNFSTELSPFDVNTHLFLWNKLCQRGKMILSNKLLLYAKMSWNLLEIITDWAFPT
jgi:hypothetical protein